MTTFKLSNLWKARISSLLGLLIPVFTGMITDLSTGSINWAVVKSSLVVSVGLFLTDILKETQKDLAGNSTEENK